MNLRITVRSARSKFNHTVRGIHHVEPVVTVRGRRLYFYNHANKIVVSPLETDILAIELIHLPELYRDLQPPHAARTGSHPQHVEPEDLLTWRKPRSW